MFRALALLLSLLLFRALRRNKSTKHRKIRPSQSVTGSNAQNVPIIDFSPNMSLLEPFSDQFLMRCFLPPVGHLSRVPSYRVRKRFNVKAPGRSFFLLGEDQDSNIDFCTKSCACYCFDVLCFYMSLQQKYFCILGCPENKHN